MALRAPVAPHVDRHDLAAVVGQRERLALEVLAVELDRLAAVLGTDLGDRAVAGDVALVRGAFQRRAPTQGEQAGGSNRRGRTAEQQGGRVVQGRFSSGASPAENGAVLSLTGIRWPAGSE